MTDFVSEDSSDSTISIGIVNGRKELRLVQNFRTAGIRNQHCIRSGRVAEHCKPWAIGAAEGNECGIHLSGKFHSVSRWALIQIRVVGRRGGSQRTQNLGRREKREDA